MKQFNVGDRLRVIDNDMREDQLKIGATCEVIHTENFGRSVKVKFDDPSNWTEGFLFSNRFELCHNKSLDQDLALARTFLNKKVKYFSSPTSFTVKKYPCLCKGRWSFSQIFFSSESRS